MKLEQLQDKFKESGFWRFHLNRISSRSNGYSMMPVVGTLTRRMSCCVGR